MAAAASLGGCPWHGHHSLHTVGSIIGLSVAVASDSVHTRCHVHRFIQPLADSNGCQLLGSASRSCLAEPHWLLHDAGSTVPRHTMRETAGGSTRRVLTPAAPTSLAQTLRAALIHVYTDRPATSGARHSGPSGPGMLVAQRYAAACLLMKHAAANVLIMQAPQHRLQAVTAAAVGSNNIQVTALQQVL